MNRLPGASVAQQASLAQYLRPEFLQKGPEEKTKILQTIKDLVLPEKYAGLQKFHLPRYCGSSAEPISFSMEAEQVLNSRRELLNFYGPPQGRLDVNLLTESVMQHILPMGNSLAWTRMNSEARRRHVAKHGGWKNLSWPAKMAYLREYQHKDPKITLWRLDDPNAIPKGNPLPPTLADTLKWEGLNPLEVAEITTGRYYDSMDLLFRDVEAINKISARRPGFHVHLVRPFPTASEVREWGPRMLSVAAISDLLLFSRNCKSSGSLMHHPHLGPWDAKGVQEVASSLAIGSVEPAEWLIHKFHAVGFRGEIYGPDRLGCEIRGVPVGDYGALNGLTHDLTNILAENLDRVPPAPWPGWDAGEEGLVAKHEALARQYIGLKNSAEHAVLDFESILELLPQESDRWKYASPYWNYAAVPGVQDHELSRIKEATDRFSADLFKMSAHLSEALEVGREIDVDYVQLGLKQAVRRFHVMAKVDEVIDRTIRHWATSSAFP